MVTKMSSSMSRHVQLQVFVSSCRVCMSSGMSSWLQLDIVSQDAGNSIELQLCVFKATPGATALLRCCMLHPASPCCSCAAGSFELVSAWCKAAAYAT